MFDNLSKIVISDVFLSAHTGNTIKRGGERDIKGGTLSAPHLTEYNDNSRRL